jgi:hypothetical protein
MRQLLVRQLIEDHPGSIHIRLGRTRDRAVENNLRRHPSKRTVSKYPSGGSGVACAGETKVA